MAILKATQAVDGGSVYLKSSEGGALVTIDQKVIWTAQGYGYQTVTTSAVAGLVVRPSTVALGTLRNNSPNKNLVIERAFAFQLVSTTAAAFYSIWLCSHPAGMAAVTNDITVRNSTNGGAAGGSETSYDVGATVIDDGWFPWGMSTEAEPTGVLPGSLITAEIGGRIIVPPTGGLSIHIVAATTDLDCTVGFHWFEVPTTELNTA